MKGLESLKGFTHHDAQHTRLAARICFPSAMAIRTATETQPELPCAALKAMQVANRKPAKLREIHGTARVAQLSHVMAQRALRQRLFFCL